MFRLLHDVVSGSAAAAAAAAVAAADFLPDASFFFWGLDSGRVFDRTPGCWFRPPQYWMK